MKCKECGNNIEEILEMMGNMAESVKRPIVVVGNGASRSEVIDDEELTLMCDLICGIQEKVSALEFVMGVINEKRLQDGKDPSLWAFNLLGGVRQGVNDAVAQTMAHIKVGRKHPMMDDEDKWKENMA